MNEAESRNVINKFICDKVNGILKYFHIKDFIDQMMNACTQSRRVFHQPLTNKLWEFIFKKLLEKSLSADNEDGAYRISSARGGWVLENGDFTDEFDYSLLMPYIKEVAYDESLLFWHISTELCYQKDKDLPNSKDDKELSKLLSYYTLYILYQQPGMMSKCQALPNQGSMIPWPKRIDSFTKMRLNLRNRPVKKFLR